ncbi:hypothetical protein K492DRAFT_176989 [Lichtheimia hyalospora FSU 10163]|nr:hypothetical protein K492DRAFT_176989 [Lichtheimia hyalospora FSU 10163]
MGCCVSRAADDDNPHRAAAGGKPFKRASLCWTADTPITRSQLEKQRETFWETAPTFEGRPEIWQAIQAAVDTSDITMAQSILDAANVIIPTGNPSEGCYDELGNRYVIPMYCLVDPTNLVNDNEATTAAAISPPSPPTAGSASVAPIDTPKPLVKEKTSNISLAGSEMSLIPITVRLSTAQDIKVDISRHDETVASLRTRIFMQAGNNITPTTHTIRLIYLGRVLTDEDRILCETTTASPSSAESHKTSRTVVIAQGAIIQALVSKI